MASLPMDVDEQNATHKPYALFDEQTNDGRAYDSKDFDPEMYKSCLLTCLAAEQKALQDEQKSQQAQLDEDTPKTEEDVLKRRIVAPVLKDAADEPAPPPSDSDEYAADEPAPPPSDSDEYAADKPAPPPPAPPPSDSDEYAKDYKDLSGWLLSRELRLWNSFEMQVKSMPPSMKPITPESQELVGSFEDALLVATSFPLAGRVQELGYFSKQVFADHLRHVFPPGSIVTGGSLGHVDIRLESEPKSGETQPTVLCIFKSTPDLQQFDLAGSDVAAAYTAEFQDSDNPVTTFSPLSRLIAQLLSYMVLNKCRYGALSSSTRTYFLHIDDEMHPSISDAWFVGQVDYLKAWVCMHELGKSDTPDQLTKWYKKAVPGPFPEVQRPTLKKAHKRKRENSSSDETSEEEDPSNGEAAKIVRPLSSIYRLFEVKPYVRECTLEDLVIQSVSNQQNLGRGVHDGVWKNEEVTVIEYDAWHDTTCLPSYKKLLSTYGRLDRVPEKQHVPRALFASSCYGVFLLVLERVTESTEEHEDRWNYFYDEIEKRLKATVAAICKVRNRTVNSAGSPLVLVGLDNWTAKKQLDGLEEQDKKPAAKQPDDLEEQDKKPAATQPDNMEEQDEKPAAKKARPS